MSKAFDEPHRPMGQGERLWARVSTAGSANGTMVAQLQGRVDEDRMRRAVRAVARLHPLMRAHAAEPPRQDTWLVPDEVPLPWCTQTRHGDHHWETVVEQELKDTLGPYRGPLWRIRLLQGEQASELILTMHHAISDGASGYVLMTDILQAYDGRVPLPAPMALPPAYDTLLARPMDWRQWLYNARALWRMALRPAPARWAVPEGIPASAQADTRIVSAQLEARTGAALQRACRAQGQTINGLISAVYMQAAAELMGVAPGQPMAMSSAVGVRHLLPREWARAVGYLVTGCEIECPVDPHALPWALAGEITAQTKRQMRLRHAVLGLALRRLILALKPHGHQLVAAAPRTSRAHFHLTNMGRVKIPRDPGGLHLLRCFHVACVHLAQRPFINLAAVTLDGELQMVFSYCAPQTSRHHVAQLIDGMRRRLEALAALGADAPDRAPPAREGPHEAAA